MFPSSQLVFLLENAKFVDFIVGQNTATLKPLSRLIATNYSAFMNQILLCLLIAIASKLSQSQKGKDVAAVKILTSPFLEQPKTNSIMSTLFLLLGMIPSV
jgi:hypothetical protein